MCSFCYDDMPSKTAYYVRTSTDKQETGGESQKGAIEDWYKNHNLDITEADAYVDLEQSGTSSTREQFLDLVDAVERGEYTDVVMVEISRISRILATSADFIDSAVETGTTIHLLDEMIDAIDPDDPMSAFFAKQLSLWYEEEAKQARRRALRGRREALRQGKWTTKPPLGFRVVDGYLEPVIEPREVEDGSMETSYLTVVAALERIDAGESYRSVAMGSGLNRVTLMDINKNEDRRRWYLDGIADDDRVQEALDEAAV